MPTSQNGFSANDRSVIASYTVPGTSLRIALRKGDVSVVLLEFLRRYHLEVEPLHNTPQDLWGYAERTIRGSSTTLSNHASGTAVDVRATAHPLGKRGTFTPAKLAALRRLLADFGPVLRWGGDYVSRPDEMHIEINAGATTVKRLADGIRAHNGTAPAASTEEPLSWSTPLPDYYTANPDDRLAAGEMVAWGTTHAAHARDAAREALAKVTTLESKVDALLSRVVSGGVAGASSGPVALSDADVQRIAAAVIALLGRKTSA